ncbi:MAG: Mur ligase family protein [Caldilineaceae bacterium]
MRLSRLLKLSGFDTPTVDSEITQVIADNRQVTPGSIFVAVQGLRVDGHRFFPAAIASGAVAVVGTRSPDELAALGIVIPSSVVYVQATDGREALARLNAALQGFPSRDMTVIGVTGTDGKTTTCTLIESILAAAHNGDTGVITTIGARIGGVEQDTGFHVTTPEAPDVQRYLAQMRDSGCRYAIVESTSFGLDQKRVAAVDYDVAAITNITHEHLDIHGTFEAYQAAKALLFRALYRSDPKSGVPRVAVLNADDEGSYAMLQNVLAEETTANPGAVVRILRYSTQQTDVDVYADAITYDPDVTRFDLHWWAA